MPYGERYPMPTIDDLIANLKGSTVFRKLDLTNAYYQLELDEASRYITTITIYVSLHYYKLFDMNTLAVRVQRAIADVLNNIHSLSDHE